MTYLALKFTALIRLIRYDWAYGKNVDRLRREAVIQDHGPNLVFLQGLSPFYWLSQEGLPAESAINQRLINPGSEIMKRRDFVHKSGFTQITRRFICLPL